MAGALTREDGLRTVGTEKTWDVIVVGGGATGLGTAVEAASRGYKTLLFEACDFAKGTSSRSTKLVHGGVRYLQQGNVKLVLEALKERGRMLRNAPHLAHRRAFVLPTYSYFGLPFYGIGLTLYDLLARGEGIGRSKLLSPSRVKETLPTIQPKGLKGGILYHDGQFDDARFAITLFRTLIDLGGTALNYVRVTGLIERNGLVAGVRAEDLESGTTLEIQGKAVVNATGVFVDELRRSDEPKAEPILTVSQGTHVVLPRRFLPSDSALMIPRTADGRVLFAIPWHERIVVGTTDDPVGQSDIEPRARKSEREYLFEHIERYLTPKLTNDDIQSVWSGQRPLVRKTGAKNTATLSRDHTILISPSKLITVTGGKWTTYRKMGQDAVDRAAQVANLPRSPSRTAALRLHGWSDRTTPKEWERVYGSDLAAVHALAQDQGGLLEPIHPDLPFLKVEVLWAAREEMARSVEDVLARRTRALFLQAKASIQAAPLVAGLLAQELRKDARWENDQLAQYTKLASQYIW
ncbi:MAG: glycerol-3-phosphate dehydrogenase/oxidase [Bryobacteraceae bacterium]